MDVPVTEGREREFLNLFEEWKKNAGPGEAEAFEEFVRGERRKAGKVEIHHFPTFMGDRYFPGWLEGWKKRLSSGKTESSSRSSNAAHYLSWSEAEHRSMAREYCQNTQNWPTQEAWRRDWIEYINKTNPSLWSEVCKELDREQEDEDPPDSAAPPVTEKDKSLLPSIPSSSTPRADKQLRQRKPMEGGIGKTSTLVKREGTS